MVGGSRNISRRVLHFITNNYPDVNIRWLMKGEGKIFLEKKEVFALPSGVMEASPVYERLGVREGSGGLLEALVGRVVALEDRLAELEEEMRRLGESKG